MPRLSETELEDLYRRYGSLVHRRCLTLLGTATDAEDATQEVFLRAFERLPVDSGGYALAWLYATANNHCYDLTRKRSYRARMHAQHPPAPAAPASSSPPVEDRTLFRWLFGELDEGSRELGMLHFIDGFTQDEIAERTGLSRKTIGKRLRELRERLAQALEQPR